MTATVDHVALQARLGPGRPALRDLKSGRAWTYAELDNAVARIVTLLADAHRIAPGDRVATLARNAPELVLLHLACARLGAIYVPLNWRLSPPEIRSLIEDAEPSVLFGDDAATAAGVSVARLDDLAEQTAEAAPADPAPWDPDRPCLILYTSGTSGRPKGALLSEHNLMQTALNFSLLGRVDQHSVFLVDSPMFHVIGLVTSVRPALLMGGQVLVSDGFTPPRTLARLADPELRVSHYFCVPQMAAMLRAEPAYDPAALRGLTALFTGGAPHPAADIRRFLDEGVLVADGFGMSEAGTVFGMPVDRELIAAKAGACGVATPHVRTRLVDAQGRDCPPGEPGELLLKGDNITAGYWRREEDTRRAFTPDGWFRTGDIAVRDADGFHRLVDRLKDMFISGGENVYPAEIEAALAGLRGLAECACVGVPDPRWGEVGHLVIAPTHGADLNRDGVTAHLSARLARYKLPARITFVDALPRTASGKVRKDVLKADLATSGASSDG